MSEQAKASWHLVQLFENNEISRVTRLVSVSVVGISQGCGCAALVVSTLGLQHGTYVSPVFFQLDAPVSSSAPSPPSAEAGKHVVGLLRSFVCESATDKSTVVDWRASRTRTCPLPDPRIAGHRATDVGTGRGRLMSAESGVEIQLSASHSLSQP